MNIQEVLKLHKEYLESNGAKGTKADLREADLRWADLRWANLSEADLSEANLRWADLREADLRGADLRGADLRWADLRGANLREADLQVGNFHRWQYFATSETLRIGCEVHDWAKWKKSGVAIAKMHNCSAEFKAFRPVLDATRKNLQARFPKKKGENQ